MSDQSPYNDVRLSLVQTAMVELMRSWPDNAPIPGEPRRYNEKAIASLAVAYADAVIVEMRAAWKRNGAEAPDMSNAALLQRWRDAGGDFHGPIIETATMPVGNLLLFLRSIIANEKPS